MSVSGILGCLHHPFDKLPEGVEEGHENTSSTRLAILVRVGQALRAGAVESFAGVMQAIRLMQAGSADQRALELEGVGVDAVEDCLEVLCAAGLEHGAEQLVRSCEVLRSLQAVGSAVVGELIADALRSNQWAITIRSLDECLARVEEHADRGGLWPAVRASFALTTWRASERAALELVACGDPEAWWLEPFRSPATRRLIRRLAIAERLGIEPACIIGCAPSKPTDLQAGEAETVRARRAQDGSCVIETKYPKPTLAHGPTGIRPVTWSRPPSGRRAAPWKGAVGSEETIDLYPSSADAQLVDFGVTFCELPAADLRIDKGVLFARVRSLGPPSWLLVRTAGRSSVVHLLSPVVERDWTHAGLSLGPPIDQPRWQCAHFQLAEPMNRQPLRPVKMIAASFPGRSKPPLRLFRSQEHLWVLERSGTQMALRPATPTETPLDAAQYCVRIATTSQLSAVLSWDAEDNAFKISGGWPEELVREPEALDATVIPMATE